MHYEINVSLNGFHFFATHERSVKTPSEAAKLMRDLSERFPKAGGFKITCTRIALIRCRVKFDEHGNEDVESALDGDIYSDAFIAPLNWE